MRRNFLKKFDLFLILIVLVLIIIGISFIYSSGFNSSGILVTNYWQKQIIWASIGFVLMTFFTMFDYRKTQRYGLYLFGLLILLLIYTKLFGRHVNGANSWIGIGDFGIQPSEFGKIIFILYLSKFFAEHQNMSDLKKIFISLLIFAVPFGLIILQPDIGTASVYLPIYLLICFIAGIHFRYIGYFLIVLFSAVVFAILPFWNSTIPDKPIAFFTVFSNTKYKLIIFAAFFIISALGIIIRRYFHGPKYIYWINYFFTAITIGLLLSFAVNFVLDGKEYQKLRLIVFFDPYKDGYNGRGAGWNILQSKIAIGSGGLFGKGFLNGSQSHLRYLPEQHTDFIFGILTEEIGFMGGLLIFGLYLMLFSKIIYIIKKCTNKYGIYISTGILAMFAYHFFTNVGMVMGIMPVTGIPLLLLSYGGSSLWTSMICIGMLMNINYRRKQFMSISDEE